MLRILYYVLGLFLWITFFFNIEHLHIDKTAFIEVSVQVYFLTVIIVVLGILVPQRFPDSEWAMLFAGLLGFVAAKLLQTRPYWGGQYTYVTLFEFGSVFITLILAYRIGRLTADFAETVHALIFADLAERVAPSDQAETIIQREMQYARRRNRPLSIMLMEADTERAKLALSATAREIQMLLARRYSLAALTRLLARDLRRSDFILDQTGNGRLILITPETRQDQASALLQRLNNQAQKCLGITLRSGIATFPEHGLTYEELVHQAEEVLRIQPAERGKTEMLAPTTRMVQDFAQVAKPRRDSDTEQTAAALIPTTSITPDCAQIDKAHYGVSEERRAGPLSHVEGS
jgi:GGDEF domain-containing protein